MEGTIEEKAKAMGHVPEEEWKGDPDKWRPAKDFVERGENIIPILKKRHDDLEKKFGDLKSDFDITLKANKREVEEAKKVAYDLATKDYEAKIKALDKKEIEAFSDGDADEFSKIKKERADLKKPEAPKKEPEPASNAEFEDWSKKEKWYTEDPELAKEANAQGTALYHQYPDKPLSEIYKMTAENVKKLHPEKFKNPRREEPGAVEDGEGGPALNGDKSFANLPKSAKDSYKRLAAQFKLKGRDYKKEDYARDYHE